MHILNKSEKCRKYIDRIFYASRRLIKVIARNSAIPKEKKQLSYNHSVIEGVTY